MFFGKKSDYIKFSEVISILEAEQSRHHFAASRTGLDARRASLDARDAIVDAIKVLKLHHIKKHPRHYMEWRKVMNNEARYLLKTEEMISKRELEHVKIYTDEEIVEK